MGILSNVKTGQPNEGKRIIIAAIEKMGKTTLSAGAPNVLFVPLEVGYGGVNVPRTDMLTTYQQVNDLMDELIAASQQGSLPYRSIVFDSATALERCIHEQVLQRDPAYANGNKQALTMDAALGGFGKAYSHANDIFGEFLRKCDMLAVYGGVNIVLTCHTFASKVIDPVHGEYDAWDLLLHSPKNQKTYGKREMITQWADVIGFLYEPIFITEANNVQKGVSANQGRVLGLSRTPNYVAGNRFGAHGEVQIPPIDGWNHFAHALNQANPNVNLYNVPPQQ